MMLTSPFLTVFFAAALAAHSPPLFITFKALYRLDFFGTINRRLPAGRVS